MPCMKLTPILAKTAIDASHAAGAVLLRHFRTKLDVREKKDAGLVSNADYAAENAILRILKRGFPDFGFLTEEAGKCGRAGAQGRWIIDPLDGTTNFVHGFPMFCVSIAAEWEGQVIAGVIYHPILDETYVAIRGKGASVNKKKIQVSRTSKIRNTLLTTGFSYRKDVLGKEMAAFENLSRQSLAIRRPGSAALDLAYTARGVFDGFWERKLSPWDVAAGGLLVLEAGGKVTDFNGNDFRVDSGQILASNGRLHSAMLKML